MIAVCDFCGCWRGKILVASRTKDVHICGECVATCQTAIEKEMDRAGEPESPPRPHHPD